MAVSHAGNQRFPTPLSEAEWGAFCQEILHIMSCVYVDKSLYYARRSGISLLHMDEALQEIIEYLVYRGYKVYITDLGWYIQR